MGELEYKIVERKKILENGLKNARIQKAEAELILGLLSKDSGFAIDILNNRISQLQIIENSWQIRLDELEAL
jgi:hypothetical protein